MIFGQQSIHYGISMWRDRHIDQWKTIENPEIDPFQYTQLIFNKYAKAICWRKDTFFNRWCWSHSQAMGPLPKPHSLYKN